MNKMRRWGSMLLVPLFILGSASSAFAGIPGETGKKEKGKRSGWLGVVVQDVTEKLAKKEKVPNGEGAYVKEVLEESPADSAGIQEADVIVLFQGKRILDADDLVKAVQRTEPAAKVSIEISRDGEKKSLQVILGRKKTMKQRMFHGAFTIPNVHLSAGNRILGLQLTTLNEQLGEYFGAPNNEGVLIEEVDGGSSAEKAGFKAGDVIIRAGKKTIDAVEKLQKELRKYDEGDTVEIEVLRKGNKKTVSVEIEEDSGTMSPFVLPRPHFRMFDPDEFDGTDFRFEMEKMMPKIDQTCIRLNHSS